MTRRGLSIVEMLISSALFLLALGLCGTLAMAGINTRRQRMDQNGAFRESVTLFHQLQRDVQESKQVYLPDLDTLAAYQPGKTSPSLVLRLVSGEGNPEVVGWTLLDEQLVRTLYRNDFDPALPATQQPDPNSLAHKARGISRFLIQLEPPGKHFGSRLLRLELDCAKPADQKLVASQMLPR